jgi:hypothetical protein
LKRDPVDDADDVDDLLRAGVDCGHCLDDLAHDLTALDRDAACADRQLTGLLGVVGVLPDRRRQLFHARRRLFEARCLFLGALRQIAVTGRDLAG